MGRKKPFSNGNIFFCKKKLNFKFYTLHFVWNGNEHNNDDVDDVDETKKERTNEEKKIEQNDDDGMWGND